MCVYCHLLICVHTFFFTSLRRIGYFMMRERGASLGEGERERERENHSSFLLPVYGITKKSPKINLS